MLKRIEQSGERLARERADTRRSRIETALGELTGITAGSEGEAVMLSGRGLAQRYGRSAALRWAMKEACDER